MRFESIIFGLFGKDINLAQVLMMGLVVLLVAGGFLLLVRRILPRYLAQENMNPRSKQGLIGILAGTFLSFLVSLFVFILDADTIIYQSREYEIRLSTIFFGIIVIQFATLLDWYTSKLLLPKYLAKSGSSPEKSIAENFDRRGVGRNIQFIVYLVATIIILSAFDLNKTLFLLPMKGSSFPIRISSILTIGLIFLAARLFSWVVTQLILWSYYRRNSFDPGRRYAINQLVTYFIYVIAIFVTVDNIGIDLTVLWGGLAALAVGVGLGMQDIFKDFISGIILLSERTVEVNDVVNVDGKIGKIKKIGLRTSLMQGRDDTMLILPNSSLVSNNIMNWTHLDQKVRFSVKVGVSYGSDTGLVRRILLEIASLNTAVLKDPQPFVRLINFGDSSLDFELFFWSEELMGIENVLSEIRFAINDAFLKNNITIPFPQRQIWQSGSGLSTGNDPAAVPLVGR